MAVKPPKSPFLRCMECDEYGYFPVTWFLPSSYQAELRMETHEEM